MDAVASSASNMGQVRSGGLGAAMPPGAQEMLSQIPASMQAQVTAFFKDLFSTDFVMGQFTHAMQTTYFFSIILMVVGAGLALFVSGRVKKRG